MDSTPVVKYLRKEIRNGNTPLIIICGRQRSGKTAFALRIAYEVYPKKFTFENLVNSIEDFAKRMKECDHNIIILDEASVSLFVYDWNTYLHKIFTIIEDSQAYKHNITVLILPQLSKLGKLHKYDADIILTMKKIKAWDENKYKYENKYFYKYKVHHKQYDSMNITKCFLTTVYDWVGPVPLPPDHIWLPYLEVQKTFKEKILNEQLDLIIKKTAPKEEKIKPISQLNPI